MALFEGLWGRLTWATTGRIVDRWHLDSGVRRDREHPETFWIPAAAEKAALAVGDRVRLMFSLRDGWCERMWVKVTEVDRERIVGELLNQPIGIPRLDQGRKVRFRAEHIIDIIDGAEDDLDPGSASAM